MRPESDLKPHEREVIERVISKPRQFLPLGYLDNPEAANLYIKLTVKVPFLLTHEEAEKYAHLYIKHIAGVQLPKEVNDWWNLSGWRDKVGKRFNGIEEAPKNGSALWEDLSENIPELISGEELEKVKALDWNGMGLSFSLFCGL